MEEILCKDSTLSEKYPVLHRLRQHLHECVLKVVEASLNEEEVFLPNNYAVTDDFGMIRSTMNFWISSIQCFHTDWPVEVILAILKHGHHLLVGLFPVTEAGMWIRVLPEVAFDEKGKFVFGTEMTWTLDAVKKFGKRNYANEKKKDVKPLVVEEGVWVFIHYGSMLIMPASLCHAGHIRTSIEGNDRAHMYFYVENKNADKDNSLVKLGARKAAATNQYVGCDSVRTSKGVQECTELVIYNRDKGGMEGAKNQGFNTPGVKAHCELVQM
jgi:hypothetical protein